MGVIGDVHGEARRLALAIDDLMHRGVDTLVCVGDIADGGTAVDECCELLKRNGVICVAGNHDRWLIEGRMRTLQDATPISAISQSSVDYLKSLPRTATIDTSAGSLVICHGLGEDDMVRVGPYTNELEIREHLSFRRLAAQNAKTVVCGHTHIPMVRRIGPVTFINPGTLRARIGGYGLVKLF